MLLPREDDDEPRSCLSAPPGSSAPVPTYRGRTGRCDSGTEDAEPPL